MDNEGGGQAAAQHLLDLGHRDFLILSVEPPAGAGGRNAEVATLRMRGYLTALRAAGVEPLEAPTVIAPTTIEGGRGAFHAAWADGLRPTAVLAMSDVAAIGAMRAARELRIDVPASLSIVGFDDIEMAQYTDPPLTTIHQPIHLKGEEAVRILLHDPWQPDSGHAERRRLEVRLVIRGSTSQAPQMRQEVSDPQG